MTQLVYLNVLISLYEFNIWLDGYIWWKFCVNSPLRNPLTDKNADVSNTYFPRCIYIYIYAFIYVGYTEKQYIEKLHFLRLM